MAGPNDSWMYERRKTKRVRKLIELDDKDCEWVELNYGRGSFSFLLSRLLSAYRAQFATDPIDKMKISAGEVRQQVEKLQEENEHE